MKSQSEPHAGISLIGGSILMIITMVLHPAGGSLEHLLKITPMIIASHTLALISIPFSLYGFWGITSALYNEQFCSKTAFITISLGMFAVLCAALLNGLAMPLFLRQYQSAPPLMDSIKLVLSYNAALNHAFDLVFIGSACLAVLLWSIAIFLTRDLPQWIAFFGITLSIVAVIAITQGFVFFNLIGFRIFVSGFTLWTITIGARLSKQNTSKFN